MYDMYPWDKIAAPKKSRHHKAGHASPATEAIAAVQFALDRRDHGGDAEGSSLTASTAGQPSARPARQ